MASQANENGYVAIKKTTLHNRYLKAIERYPWVFGGRHSYLYITTRTYQEQECVEALRFQFSEEAKDKILGDVLAEGHVPSTLQDAIAALIPIYPSDKNEENLLSGLNLEFEKAMAKKRPKGAELREEFELKKKVLKWTCLLQRVPNDVKKLLGAWVREERDQALAESANLTCLSPSARRYSRLHVQSFQKQEKRWRCGVVMNWWDTLFYYFWIIIGLGTTCYLEIISGFQGSVLTLFRAAPISPINLLNILAILDYQFSDIRHIRSYLFTTGLGAVMAAIFGVVKLVWPKYHEEKLTSWNAFVWKAILCCAWQTGLHNWENILNFFYYQSIRRLSLKQKEADEVTNLYRKSKLTNAYLFAWVDSWEVSIRCEFQLSHYKRDHESSAKPLEWAAKIKDGTFSNRLLRQKLGILIGAIILAIWVIGCTVPLDALAGLLMISFAIPFCVRVAIDVWLQSQSFKDLRRLFIFTVGPTVPCNIGYLVNTLYWKFTTKPLFTDFRNRAFHVGIALNALATFYAKLWC